MKEKPYFETLEDFLRNADGMNIRAVTITALCENGEDAHDIACTWNCGPYELMEMASVLQLRAAELYIKANSGNEGEQE